MRHTSISLIWEGTNYNLSGVRYADTLLSEIGQLKRKEDFVMTDNNLQRIAKAIAVVKSYSSSVIEATVIKYVCERIKKKFEFEGMLAELKNQESSELLTMLRNIDFPIDIEFLIEFFEALLEKDNVTKNGIVFTPKYIADYINKNAIAGINKSPADIKVIDPGCGCGIFLVSAIDNIKRNSNKTVASIIAENIYGLEIDPDNARRCAIVLNFYVLMAGESNAGLKVNVKCVDSLKTDWRVECGVDSFHCIVGNPPYVNTHDMTKETVKFLKQTFKTTKTGVYNIFYAFIEYAMTFLDDDGKLGYIIPNNFLTIKSATALREMMSENKWIEKIIDFADNMVFKPVRTYNCIIQLSKKHNDSFAYCLMNKADDISIALEEMEVEKLDVNGWKLVDRRTMQNIHRIEGQYKPIKEFVRTGIATLRDDVYMVDYDGSNYYKDVDGEKIEIEGDLVRRLYKIPDLKQCNNIQDACRYILFPYQKGTSGFVIIPEEELKEKTPRTYNYLLKQKDELDKRDKGKPNSVAWYAYGRTQGLNKFGRKLLFPTFACTPRFTMVDDEYAFFCNGYAVFENDYMELEILRRILNSSVMQYYVSNTSYAIEGGYYCYQKKYIEKFSFPFLTDEEKNEISEMTDQELDEFLINKYELEL